MTISQRSYLQNRIFSAVKTAYLCWFDALVYRLHSTDFSKLQLVCRLGQESTSPYNKPESIYVQPNDVHPETDIFQIH